MKRRMIHFPDSLWEKLELLANQKGVKRNSLVRIAAFRLVNTELKKKLKEDSNA